MSGENWPDSAQTLNPKPWFRWLVLAVSVCTFSSSSSYSYQYGLAKRPVIHQSMRFHKGLMQDYVWQKCHTWIYMDVLGKETYGRTGFPRTTARGDCFLRPCRRSRNPSKFLACGNGPFWSSLSLESQSFGPSLNKNLKTTYNLHIIRYLI